MTQQEASERLNKCYSVCANGTQCPFMSECSGTAQTCKLKHIGLLLAEDTVMIDDLKTKLDVLKAMANLFSKYIDELEKINHRYFQIIKSFQSGWTPKRHNKRTVIRKVQKYVPVLERDGDENFASEPEHRDENKPVVNI